MDLALLLSALAMGVAAAPHCAAMCGAPCAALTLGCRRSTAGFHLGRMASYAAGGAVAAASVGLLANWSRAAPALRPVWLLLHLGLLALGLWWLATGTHAAGMQRGAVLPLRFVARRRRPLRVSLAGLAWLAWPCGVSQSALLLAALASSPQSGALVMATFAAASMPGLALAPWAWARWQRLRGASPPRAAGPAPGLRLAGLGLAASSGWALAVGVWDAVSAWCGSG